jgi:hypothetical protein
MTSTNVRKNNKADATILTCTDCELSLLPGLIHPFNPNHFFAQLRPVPAEQGVREDSLIPCSLGALKSIHMKQALKGGDLTVPKIPWENAFKGHRVDNLKLFPILCELHNVTILLGGSFPNKSMELLWKTFVIVSAFPLGR